MDHASEFWSMLELFGRFGFFKRISRNAFLLVSFTQKKRHFQLSVKYWRMIKYMASKQQFLLEKLSKLKSTLHYGSLIEYQIKQTVRKNVRVICALSPQPKGALQNYSMLRPGYRRVSFLDTKYRTYCHSICAEKIGQHWILCFKKTHHHDNDCKMNG